MEMMSSEAMRRGFAKRKDEMKSAIDKADMAAYLVVLGRDECREISGGVISPIAAIAFSEALVERAAKMRRNMCEGVIRAIDGQYNILFRDFGVNEVGADVKSSLFMRTLKALMNAQNFVPCDDALYGEIADVLAAFGRGLIKE